MKPLSLIILLILHTHTLSCQKKMARFILKDHRSIDGIHIGMSIKNAVNVLGKKYMVEKKKIIIFDDQPESIEYIVINNKNQTLFSFNAGHERDKSTEVFRIVINNPTYITLEGINVGMSIKELKTKTKLKNADFNFDDGLFISSATFDGGFWIAIDDKKEYKFTYDSPTMKDIPEDLIIKGIIIF